MYIFVYMYVCMTLNQYFVPPLSIIFDPARQFVVSLLFAYRDDVLYNLRVPLFGNRSALTILYLAWLAEKGFLDPKVSSTRAGQANPFRSHMILTLPFLRCVNGSMAISSRQAHSFFVHVQYLKNDMIRERFRLTYEEVLENS